MPKQKHPGGQGQSHTELISAWGASGAYWKKRSEEVTRISYTAASGRYSSDKANNTQAAFTGEVRTPNSTNQLFAEDHWMRALGVSTRLTLNRWSYYKIPD